MKFDFDFVCYFWKSSFVLYFSGFFIGSRSVGHPRDMETHKDLFCGLCVCGERVHHHSATPRVASFSRQKNIREKIVPFFRLCRESVSLDPRQLTPRTVSDVHTHLYVYVIHAYLGLLLFSRRLLLLCKTHFLKGERSAFLSIIAGRI